MKAIRQGHGRFSVFLGICSGLYLLSAGICTAAAANQDLPSDSVYHLDVELQDQTGKMVKLEDYRGAPVVVTMFYASCPHVCPTIISTIKFTESKLSETQRDHLQVLSISIDPERDTPSVLRESLERHRADPKRWSMTRPAADDLRAISGVFGVKYKQLPDGEFNHTTKLVLLDAEGRQVASTETLGRIDASFLQAIEAELPPE